MVVHVKGVLILVAQLALPVLGSCVTSVPYSPLGTDVHSGGAAASGADGGAHSGNPPALVPSKMESTATSEATATTIYTHGGADDQLPPLMPANTDSKSSDGHDIVTSSTTSSDGLDMHATTTSSDPLAIHVTATSSSDPLAIHVTATSSSDPLAVHVTISSSSDPLAIHISTSKTTTSGSSPSHTGVQAGASPSSGTSGGSETPLMAALRPCSNSTSGYVDCRLSMKHNCSRAHLQYPTCIDGACLCMAAPCATDRDCGDYNNCLVDEQAKCTKDTTMYPHMQGVCTCRPRFEGCMKEAQPQEFCESRLNCTEKHRELYPLAALCVAEDENEAFAHGRCLCKAVNCVVTGHKERDEAACKGLVECREADRKTPVCFGKYGARLFPDEGYCSCH